MASETQINKELEFVDRKEAEANARDGRAQLAQIIFHGRVRERGGDYQPGDVLNFYATREHNGCAIWAEFHHPKHPPLKHMEHFQDRNAAIEEAVRMTFRERARLGRE